MRRWTRAATALAAAVALSMPAGAVSASASPVARARAASARPASHCTHTSSARTTSAWHGHEDTSPVTPADLAALPERAARPRYVARNVAPQLAAEVRIPVYAHVIRGAHRGEQTPLSPRRIRRLLAVLNRAMAGRQSALSAPARYRFLLHSVSYTKRDGWYHARLYGPRDRKMKQALHRGHARTLNLYFNGGGDANSPVLGWSRFPWQYAGTPRLDGVSVSVASLPGGSASGYNRGDTLVHETGHWLGLLHTFEGGCDGNGDLVADTPAEAEPSFGCSTTRDTCPSPGTDPVHNFLDYSFDTCMDMFTPGQVSRMDAAFVKWRQ